MHNRKEFIVYTPEYDPTYGSGSKYFKYYSLGKAKKVAIKMGKGAMIMVSISNHPGKFTRWNSNQLNYVCEVV